MKRKKETNLGKYIYYLIIQRGFDNVNDYLRKYELNISNVYYRDVESGTKIVSVETADTLCKSLDADRLVFFSHLLHDLLPTDIIEKLLKPVAHEVFSNLEEYQAILRRDKNIYEEAFAKHLLSETYVLSDEATAKLIERPDYMPILHFLYATESAKSKELASVLEQNNISESPEKIAKLFEELGMADIEGDLNKSGEWRIRRKATISRAPLTEDGVRLKRSFAHREIDKIFEQKKFNSNWSNEGAFEDCAILELSPTSVKMVKKRILDSIAEAHSRGESISDGETNPYFLGIFFGSRLEYAPRKNSDNS